MPISEYSFDYRGVYITARYEWEFGSPEGEFAPPTHDYVDLLFVFHEKEDISHLLKEEYLEEIQSECYKIQFQNRWHEH